MSSNATLATAVPTNCDFNDFPNQSKDLGRRPQRSAGDNTNKRAPASAVLHCFASRHATRFDPIFLLRFKCDFCRLKSLHIHNVIATLVAKLMCFLKLCYLFVNQERYEVRAVSLLANQSVSLFFFLASLLAN